MANEVSRESWRHESAPVGNETEHLRLRAEAAEEQLMLLRDALLMWLRWNDAYETSTAQMFRQDANREQLEAMMDRMDALRRQAIELSQELLD